MLALPNGLALSLSWVLSPSLHLGYLHCIVTTQCHYFRYFEGVGENENFKKNYGHYIGASVKHYLLGLFSCKKGLAPWAMYILPTLFCMADGPGIAPWGQCPGQWKADKLEATLGYIDEHYLDPLGWWSSCHFGDLQPEGSHCLNINPSPF